MGQIINCTCDHCKYSKTNLFLGSGKMRGIFHFPSYDTKGGQVVDTNVSDLLEIRNGREVYINPDKIERMKARGKVLYFTPGAFKRKLFLGRPLSTAPLYLQSKYNYCPKCEKFKLRFLEVGLFD